MEKSPEKIVDETLFESPSDTQSQAKRSGQPGELELATLVAVEANGMAVLQLPDQATTTLAMSTVPIMASNVGRQVAVMFVEKPERQAIVIGLIRSQLDSLLDVMELADDTDASEVKNTVSENSEKTVKVDGERVLLTGQEEVVLKCGAASITLTKAGKIVIRGKSLLNRASGVNRIMGGSVQVN